MMKARYSRKPVPLEVRGISRDQIESHPLPEQADDYYNDGTYQFSHDMGEIPYSMGPTTYSGQSSPDHGQSNVSHGMLSISLGGNTGNTTERSSICSLGEDDFEREATREVHAMFEEIDSALFEGEKGPPQLSGECSEWVSVFPHLRILGRQIVSPQDVGYEFIEGDDTPRIAGNVLMDVTEQDISHSHAVHELSVMGQHLQAYQAPLDVLSARLAETPYEEEIIEQDGQVEDIIAIDYKSIEDDSRSVHTNHNRRRPRGLPPVTPQACVKDNIAGAAFDYLWSESISWLRPMVKHYADNIVLDQDDIRKEQDAMDHDVFHEFSSPRDHQYGPSREYSMYSRLGLHKGLYPGGLLTNPPETLNKLDGVLTISTKALQSRAELQSRERSMLGDEPTLERSLATLRAATRPMSSFRDQGRPMSVVKYDSTRLNSARNLKTRGKLAPIERVKTPSVEEERKSKLTNEGVRGHGITTINERLGSPPSPFSRIGALPPIGLDLDLQAGILPARKRMSQRASSAVHNEARIHIREREKTVLGVPHENRPSTTHALYRSETPLGLGGRRSSTPVGFNTLRLQHGTQAVAVAAPMTNVNLNVTGNSINPQMDAGLDLDDSDVNYDDITSQRWGASNLHPQIRRTKQQHFVVR